MKHFAIGMAIAALSAASALADPVAGVWKTESNEEGSFLQVSVAPCGAAICGTISAAMDSSGTASPDYEHLNKRMIWDMIPADGGTYVGGRIWDPENDRTYRSKMILSGNRLTVEGCVAGGLVCRGQDWTRVN